MLVTPKNLNGVLKTLAKAGTYALDTETTGLRPYHGDKLFSLIIADEGQEYYFNFQDYPAEKVVGLPRSVLELLKPVLENPLSKWRLSNAKYDLAIIASDGLSIAGEIHDTEAIARVEKNNRFRLGLDALAKELGLEKDGKVEAYIDEHKLYELAPVEDEDDDEYTGKGEKKKPCYWKVPFRLIVPYACNDARCTYVIAEHQEKRIAETMKPELKLKPLEKVFLNEKALTPVLFTMERNGILLDREYAAAGLMRERKRAEEIKEEFAKLTGEEFTDSAKCFAPLFDKLGVRYPRTETGRPSFKADFLADMKQPIARLIQGHRDSLKRANTYYANFLYFADDKNRIHLSMRQAGTKTGRLSAANPNLQNLTKRKDKGQEFPVRRSFIPTPGYFFGFLDLDQAEYRLMLERAKQMELIRLVQGGLDVHTATAQMMAIDDREWAKTINFMLIYGGGIAKLCMMLFNPTLPLETLKALGRRYIYKMRSYEGKDVHDALIAELSQTEIDYNLGELVKAHDLLEKYFSVMPEVKEYTKSIQKVAKERGFIVNWMGRRSYYRKGESTHMAANHDIQGGIADVVKVAMVQMAPLFVGKKSRMLLQVHDELIFEIHPSEADLLNQCRRIMETAYPHKYLPITCGADYSFKSWADKVKWEGTIA